jgi:mRNA-degrading endonuclease RelE of RelBE toxin-antitoxin system
MAWRVRHTRTFYKELARLPAKVRSRVEEIAFGEAIKEDPFLGGRVQKL